MVDGRKPPRRPNREPPNCKNSEIVDSRKPPRRSKKIHRHSTIEGRPPGHPRPPTGQSCERSFIRLSCWPIFRREYFRRIRPIQRQAGNRFFFCPHSSPSGAGQKNSSLDLPGVRPRNGGFQPPVLDGKGPSAFALASARHGEKCLSSTNNTRFAHERYFFNFSAPPFPPRYGGIDYQKNCIW